MTCTDTINRRWMALLVLLGGMAWMPAAPASAQDIPGVSPDAVVETTPSGMVDLKVRSTALGRVLEMLALPEKRNIILSSAVDADQQLTVNLFDVRFDEALSAILSMADCGARQEGRFIFVHTLEEMQAFDDAARRMTSRVYRLEHLAPQDAEELIVPMLSMDGKHSSIGKIESGFQPTIEDGGGDGYAAAARLIVNDYPEILDQISALLAEIDTPPLQVLIEATIIQTKLGRENAFGVDFAAIGSLDLTDLTNPLAGVDNLLLGSNGGFQPGDNEGWALNGTLGQTDRDGTLKIGILHDDVGAFLRVLDEVTDSTILSRPRIMCLNRQKAELQVGRDVGYARTTLTNDFAQQDVQFVKSGITLSFRPFISADGMIRLELRPEVSEVIVRTDANGNDIPDKFTNNIATNVRIRDGQTLVMGGLFVDRDNAIRRRVPFLSNIPILGELFKGHDDSTGREEIIFMITPRIVRDDVIDFQGNAAFTPPVTRLEPVPRSLEGPGSLQYWQGDGALTSPTWRVEGGTMPWIWNNRIDAVGSARPFPDIGDSTAGTLMMEQALAEELINALDYPQH